MSNPHYLYTLASGLSSHPTASIIICSLYVIFQFFYAADEDDRNEVVVKVLELLAVLVKFGYYDDSSDIEPLLPSIEKLLSGSDDYPTRQIKASMEWTFRDELHRS